MASDEVGVTTTPWTTIPPLVLPGRSPVVLEVVVVVGSVVVVVEVVSSAMVVTVVVVDAFDRAIRFEIVTMAATITANQTAWMARRWISFRRRVRSSRFRFAARFWR